MVVAQEDDGEGLESRTTAKTGFILSPTGACMKNERLGVHVPRASNERYNWLQSTMQIPDTGNDEQVIVYSIFDDTQKGWEVQNSL